MVSPSFISQCITCGDMNNTLKILVLLWTQATPFQFFTCPFPSVWLVLAMFPLYHLSLPAAMVPKHCCVFPPFPTTFPLGLLKQKQLIKLSEFLVKNAWIHMSQSLNCYTAWTACIRKLIAKEQCCQTTYLSSHLSLLTHLIVIVGIAFLAPQSWFLILLLIS